MALIIKDNGEDKTPEFNPAEVIRMEKFTEWIKGLAIYLGNFHRAEDLGFKIEKKRKLISINDYDKHVLNATAYEGGYICIAGGKGKSSNIYVQAAIPNIFPLFIPNNNFTQREIASYNCKLPKYSLINRHKVWRDDITTVPTTQRACLSDVLKSFQNESSWDNRKYYNIFWNLFIIALDDDIYNNQLSNVIELAHYWNFNEPMLRDWCRAVEYVMNGNKLSKNCDFECETVEGAQFFLHKEYDDAFK